MEEMENRYKAVELQEVCEILDNKRKPVTKKDRQAGLYPYYGANGVLDYVDGYLFDGEFVLLAEDGGFFDDPSRGVAYRISGKCWVNNHAHVLKAKQNIDIDYLGYVLKNYDVRPYVSGAVVKKLNQSAIRKMLIPLPPLDFQKEIVDKLDRASLLIQKRKEAIDLLDQYLKNVFLEMFGDPISNPKKWATKTIEEIVKKEKYSIKRGPFGGSLKKDMFVEDGYLVYEQFHALNRDFSFARYYIDEKKFQELKAFEVKAGDIIISCSGVYLGKLAEIPKNYKKGIINQALLKISLNNEIMRNKLFMDIFTNPSFKAEYLDNKIGSGIPNFPPVSVFKTFQFICPEINIQKEYENKVKEVENLRMKMLEQISELEQLMQSLNQKYFSN